MLLNHMKDEQNEIEEFVKSCIAGIEKGIGKDHYIRGDIDFELAIVKTKDVGGGFKIFVADAKGKYSSEKISKVKFQVRKEDGETVFGGVK